MQENNYGWFSRGVASLPAGKSQDCAKMCYIESLPLVLKDNRSCFSQGKRSTEQLPFDHAFGSPEVEHLINICIHRPREERSSKSLIHQV